MLSLTAQHAEDSGSADVSSTRQAQSSTRIGGGFGLRHVFNPGGVIEVSVYIAVEATWLRMKQSREYYYDHEVTGRWASTSEGTQIESHAGLVLEYRLLEQLYLRLATPLLAASYHHEDGHCRWDGDEVSQATTGNGYKAGLRVSPHLQVRMIF